MALRASGRLWMTVHTLPDFSMRTLMGPPGCDLIETLL
jgi:hypothetical protein